MKITVLLMTALLLCAYQAQNTTRDKALESLANAERAFSATSEAKGISKAFTEHLAPDGLVFTPKPTNAHAFYASAPPSNALLTWYPAHADIANSLDFGYTTGPYQLKATPDAAKATGAGFYLSVWRRQADGQWKVAVDMGNSFAADLLKQETYRPAAAMPKSKKNRGTEEDLLAKDVQQVQPYHPETLIYRHGQYPFKYKDAVIEPAANVVYTHLGHEIASTSDMAYTYGSYTQPTGKGTENGHYLKVWKMLNGQWQLAAHNLVPDKK